LRFVDASVFIHAFIKPKRELKPHEVKIKESAKEIVKRISQGEEVATTVVQIAEIANILESYMPIEALKVEESLLLTGNLKVYGVTKKDCINALKTAKDKSIGLSDAIAHLLMIRNDIREIYSFDRDFDRLEGIKRIVK
jgi:hypothetical protein